MSEDFYLSIPGHIPAEEAAKRLGITVQRVYQHIKAGHLSAVEVKNQYMIPEAEVENFRTRPPGRVRKRAAAWHMYDRSINVLNIQISVQVRVGQQERFRERVRQLYGEKQHAFKGTMIRVIWQNQDHPEQARLLLVWKDNEMPDEATRQRELEAFQRDFADVLDWDTARIEHGNVLLST
jgi:excisionase family DNA binding protein